MRVGLKMMAVVLLAAPMMAGAQKMASGSKMAMAKGDSWAGTWTLNAAKSKFPDAGPQTEVLTITQDGMLSLHEVDSKGKNHDWHYTPVEGKPVQVMGRDGKVMVTVHTVDAHRREQTWDSNGKPSKSYATVSADGKTQTFYALDGKGGVTEMVVYEKQ